VITSRAASTRRFPLFVVFGAMGATAALVPAVLPLVGAAVSASVLQAAPTLFGGLLVGVLLSPTVARRTGLAWAVRIGSFAQFAGLLVLALSTEPWEVFVAAALSGLGFGTVEASATTLARSVTGSVASGSAAHTLALLTATVAIVATVGPLLVVAAGASWFRFVLGIAAVIHLAAAALLRDVPGSATETRTHLARAAKAFPRPLLFIGIALFLYVGVESTLSGLSAATVQSTLATSATVSALGTSAFWLLMTAGRFSGAAVLSRGTDPRRLAIVALAAIAVLLAVAVFSPSPVVTLVFLALAVVACGPCYALLIGTAGRWMSERSTGATALLIAMGAVGGTVLPAVVIASGGLQVSVWIPAAAAIAGVCTVALSSRFAPVGRLS
jgi:fucose permease